MQVFAPLPGVVSAALGQGYLGVTFFFVLSGFVLTWSASVRVSPSTFYWRRFSRIYPSHFVALLFAIPVFYSFDPGPDPGFVKPLTWVLALSFVLLQGWSNNPAILFSGNPAAWTLTCEAFFYALHPYLSKLLNPLAKRGAIIFGACTIFLAFSYRGFAVAFPDSWLPDTPTPIVRLTEFALGMAVAWAFRQGWRPRIPVLAGFASIVAIVAAIVIVPAFVSDSLLAFIVTRFGNEFVTVACALTIAAIAKRSLDGRKSVFASRVHVRLGEWSFAFYLVHATFVYLAMLIFGFRGASWSNVIWYVPMLLITLAGAAALHHGVEKPLEQRMRRWKDARAVA